MLARDNRLRKAHEIARVYKRGVYGGAGGVVSVKAAPSGRAQTRVVIVVAKKVSKRAVVRNLIRRRVSGDIEKRWATLRAGYDIVISAHSDISDLSPGLLGAHLTKALTAAGVIS